MSYDGVSKNVTAVCFHEDDKWMFTGGEDCSARIWELRYVWTWVQLCYIDCIIQLDIGQTNEVHLLQLC